MINTTNTALANIARTNMTNGLPYNTNHLNTGRMQPTEEAQEMMNRTGWRGLVGQTATLATFLFIVANPELVLLAVPGFFLARKCTQDIKAIKAEY